MQKFDKEILNSRRNMKNLEDWLNENNFWEKPASPKYHGSFKGGLYSHCSDVYNNYLNLLQSSKIKMDDNSILFVSLVHDICKTKAYTINKDGTFGYNWDYMKSNPGHSTLTLKILDELDVEYTDLEKNIILYHMGPYGTHEFENNGKFAEYTFYEMITAWNEPRVKLFYFADNISSLGGKK